MTSSQDKPTDDVTSRNPRSVHVTLKDVSPWLLSWHNRWIICTHKYVLTFFWNICIIFIALHCKAVEIWVAINSWAKPFRVWQTSAWPNSIWICFGNIESHSRMRCVWIGANRQRNNKLFTTVRKFLALHGVSNFCEVRLLQFALLHYSYSCCLILLGTAAAQNLNNLELPDLVLLPARING